MTDLVPVPETIADPFPMPTVEQIEALRGSETLNAFAPVARAINAANGWAPEFSFHQTPIFTALIDSEINEAYEEWNVHRVREYVYELGDVIIRAADLIELLLPGALAHQDLSPSAGMHLLPVPEEVRLLQLYRWSALALQAYRKVPDIDGACEAIMFNLVEQIRFAHWMIVCRQSEPAAILTDLLQANRVRGKRHGGRRC